MAAAWFLGPYVRDDVAGHGQPTRFFVQADFFQQLAAAGGEWRGPAEMLGNYGILKVRAAPGVLDAIANRPGVERIPKDRLDEPLADLPPAAQQRLRDFALARGFTLAEINEHLPNPIGTYTLRQVLMFFLRRWRRPRYNATNDTIEFETVDRPPPATLDALRADELLIGGGTK